MGTVFDARFTYNGDVLMYQTFELVEALRNLPPFMFRDRFLQKFDQDPVTCVYLSGHPGFMRFRFNESLVENVVMRKGLPLLEIRSHLN